MKILFLLCALTTFIHKTDQRRGRISDIRCSKPCPRNLAPVCASNGKTYSNKCIMDGDAKCKGLKLTILHDGRCDVDVCSLPAQPGKCRASMTRFYYDELIQQCRRFTYGGCGGNKNNFGTEQQCEKRCLKGNVKQTPYLINDMDCWGRCGSKGGSCSGFCGVDGYCCRKGYNDCIKIYRDVATSNHHKCIRGNPPGTPKTCIEKKCKGKLNFAPEGCFTELVVKKLSWKVLFDARSTVKWDAEGFKAYACGVVCRCGQAARDQGYRFFGIHYFGVCVAGNVNPAKVGLETILWKSKACIRGDGTYKQCDNSGECVALLPAVYVYRL